MALAEKIMKHFVSARQFVESGVIMLWLRCGFSTGGEMQGGERPKEFRANVFIYPDTVKMEEEVIQCVPGAFLLYLGATTQYRGQLMTFFSGFAICQINKQIAIMCTELVEMLEGKHLQNPGLLVPACSSKHRKHELDTIFIKVK